MTENLYDVLKLSTTATQEEIRKSYRKMAIQYHPDRNPSPEAEETFQQLTKAYEVLNDPERRSLYDQYGSIALNPNFKGFEKSDHSQFGSFSDFFSGFSSNQGTQPYQGSEGYDEHHSKSQSWNEESYETFSFGTGSKRRTRSSTEGGGYVPPARGSDIPVSVSISLVDAINGCDKQVRVARQSRWKKGSNSGVHQELITVNIPSRTESETVIRLLGKGNYGQGGGDTGDLVVSVQIQSHPYLSRLGADLYLRVPLTWKEALDGARVDVPLLNGQVTIQIPSGVKTGQKLRLKNRGLQKDSGGQGDLYLILQPELPVGNTERIQEVASKIEDLYPPQGVRGDFRLD